MKKSQLIDLLYELKDYMDNLSDADGDSEGMYPNKEMSLSIRISDALYALGEVESGDAARASVDPDYKPNTFESKKVVKLTESQLKKIVKKVLNEQVPPISIINGLGEPDIFYGTT
jgi:hypothetical protein